MCDLFVSEFDEVYGDGYKWPDISKIDFDFHQFCFDGEELADSED